jgi:hypothetical protein
MLKIDGKIHDLGGGMMVRRVLPFAKKRMVGPFTFFDHMGPFQTRPGQDTDVRPHPHIGLSTLTYLFEGRIVHRDSLGTKAIIQPGEVNWMTAGSGISHSERSHEDDRGKVRTLHGLQFWVALPDGKEEVDPSFQHYEYAEIPRKKSDSIEISVVAGEAFGLKSPVLTSSPLFLADIKVRKDQEISLDLPDFEIAVYVIEGRVLAGSQSIDQYQMGVWEPKTMPVVKATEGSRFILLGGEAFTTPRHIWWNLVSSSREKIEETKMKWKDGTFPMVPGETERIPLPEK